MDRVRADIRTLNSQPSVVLVVNANDRSIAAVTMLAHATVHVYEMVLPLFVVSWLVEFQTIDIGLFTADVTTASVGLVLTFGYFCFGVGSLPAGLLVDRLGSRRLIGAALLGMGSSYLMLGFAPNMFFIAVALFVWGTAASIYHPAGLTLISNGAQDRGTTLAYHGVAGNLGVGLGPLSAAVSLAFIDWRTLAIALGIPALLAAIWATQAEFDETAAVMTDGGGESSTRSPVASLATFLDVSRKLLAGSFLLVFVIVMCSGLYYRGFLSFLPEILRGLPGFDPIAIETVLPQPLRALLGEGAEPKMIHPQDYFYAGLLLVGVLGQYVGGKLVSRIRVELGIALAFALLAILALVFLPATAMGLGALLLIGGFLGFTLFVVQPLYQAAVAEYTPPKARGISYGLTYTGVFGVGAFGGVIAGSILAYATPSVLFLTIASIAIVGMAIAASLVRRPSA